MRYTIRRVSPFGALFYGLILGVAIWLPPGVALGWLVRSLIFDLKDWLADLTLTIPVSRGVSVDLDLMALLPLGDIHERLESLSGQGTMLFFAIALGMIAAGMLLTGLSSFLGALLYNLFARLFGGVEMTVDALDQPASRQAPPVEMTYSPRPAGIPAAAVAPAEAPRPRRGRGGPVRSSSVAWLALASNTHDRWALRDDVTRVGSSPDNDIILPGLALYHAEIRRESDRYLVYDLGSRRTWVDDVQVAAVHMLKNGSHLQLGQSVFVVHISATGSTVGSTP